MRVLQICKFYWPVLGGIEKVAWELSEGLAKLGLCADVLCSNQQLRTVRERSPAGYQVVRAGSMGRVLATSVAPSMVGELRRQAANSDLIHLHMPDPMAALALWACVPKVPVVVHWHSDVVRRRRAMKLYEPLQRWVLERADAIIATSQPYADSSPALQRWRDKVRVIPIGISEQWGGGGGELAADLCRRYGGRRVVFSLGRMVYYKGFDVLIEAATALPDDVVVVIGGDGELLESHRQLVRRRGLEGKVDLVGHIPDHELGDYFKASDVFCLASTVRSEAYGVAIVEAMMSGKPVVASNIPGSGVPWVNVHGTTGLNVPVGRPAELAQALKTLLTDDGLMHRLGSGARHRYQRDFRATQMIDRVARLYSELGSRATRVRSGVRFIGENTLPLDGTYG